MNVYKKYVNILTNILKNVPVAIQRCCIWKQLREKCICPDCGANNSDRLIISFLQKEELQKAAEGYKVLYVLPTAAVSAWIQINCPHIKYVTVDSLAQITDFAVTDTTFDLVIYSPKMWNAHEEEERFARDKTAPE